MEKRFRMIDEGFICDYCGKEVKPLNYTARDHCPFCLSSKHVDINPGDRLQTCHGKLSPIEMEKYKDTYKIVYKCDKCHMIKKNIMASDDDLDTLLDIIKKYNC